MVNQGLSQCGKIRCVVPNWDVIRFLVINAYAGAVWPLGEELPA
jgi:hypothetical protein